MSMFHPSAPSAPSAPTAHMTARLEDPKVATILGYHGVYAVHFGPNMDVHLTAAQWEHYDACVRAGILAVQTRAIS